MSHGHALYSVLMLSLSRRQLPGRRPHQWLNMLRLSCQGRLTRWGWSSHSMAANELYAAKIPGNNNNPLPKQSVSLSILLALAGVHATSWITCRSAECRIKMWSLWFLFPAWLFVIAAFLVAYQPGPGICGATWARTVIHLSGLVDAVLWLHESALFRWKTNMLAGSAHLVLPGPVINGA